MKKGVFWNLGLYALGFGVLGLVIYRNRERLSEVLSKPLDFPPLILGGCICFFGLLLNILRWYVLVRAQELPFRISDALRLGLIGFFLSSFLPGSISGDVIKAAFLMKEQSRRTVAVATVLMDRALGLWGLIWVIALFGGGFWILGDSAITSQERLQWIIVIMAGIVAVTLTSWLCFGLFSNEQARRLADRLDQIPKVGHSFAELWRAVWLYRRRGKHVAAALGMALVAHCCFAIAFFLGTRSLQKQIDITRIPTLVQHFVFFPIGETIQVFFPAPGGMGGAEYGYGELYNLVGGNRSDGEIAALIYRVILWSLGLIGFVIYLTMKPSLKLVNKETFELAEAHAGNANG